MGIYETVRYNDDQKDVSRWFKRMIWIVGLFCISGCYSWDELHYTIAGVKTEASVTDIKSPAVGNQNTVSVYFQFTDTDGKPHSHRTAMSASQASTVVSEERTFQLIYLRSDPAHNEPVALRHLGYVVVFLIMTCILVGYIVKIARDVKQEEARDRARRHGH